MQVWSSLAYWKKENTKMEPIKFSALKRMSVTNSKDLPGKIKFQVDEKWYYKEWVGIGWIDIDQCDDAVEVVDD